MPALFSFSQSSTLTQPYHNKGFDVFQSLRTCPICMYSPYHACFTTRRNKKHEDVTQPLLHRCFWLGTSYNEDQVPPQLRRCVLSSHVYVWAAVFAQKDRRELQQQIFLPKRRSQVPLDDSIIFLQYRSSISQPLRLRWQGAAWLSWPFCWSFPSSCLLVLPQRVLRFPIPCSHHQSDPRLS